MSIEFDFIFNGRTESARPIHEENFFRIGENALEGDGCNGQGSKYPSMWLNSGANGPGSSGLLDIQFTEDAASCSMHHYLNDYCAHSCDSSDQEINIGVSHHMKISLNQTQVLVEITGGSTAQKRKPDPYIKSILRNKETPKSFLGNNISVWFMSNKFAGTDYNVGGGIFSNIVIKSKIFTFAPTAAPIAPTVTPTNVPSVSPITIEPTVTPTDMPTTSPTNIPSQSPSIVPTISPTIMPSLTPTDIPSLSPSDIPTVTPTQTPTISSDSPTQNPTIPGTYPPTITTNTPTITPSVTPTLIPSNTPTIAPTNNPTTSFPTSSAPITVNYILTIDEDFDTLLQNLINHNITLETWAFAVISSGIGVNEYPILSQVIIVINEVFSGSVMIDYVLNSTGFALLEWAINNINNAAFITVGSVTYEVVSNMLITFSPTNTATPTPSPTDTPSLTPTNIPTQYPTYPTITSLSPTDFPTMDPTAIPTNIPSQRTQSPTTTTTKRPTFAWFPYTTTTTEYPLTQATDMNVVPHDQQWNNSSTNYEYVQITIFSTVIALCFCTVFCFLAYLTFKRRLSQLQRKKNLEPPRYQLELSKSNLPNKHTHLSHLPSKSSKTNTLTVNYLQSPNSGGHRHKYNSSLTPEHLNYDLGQYKDDSAPNSINISVMHLNKDCTPTPNVSPNVRKQSHKSVDIVIMDDDIDTVSVHETSEIEIGYINTDFARNTSNDTTISNDSQLSEHKRTKWRKPPRVSKRKLRKTKKKSHTNTVTESVEETNESSIKPYEQVLDGYADGIYTNALNEGNGYANDTDKNKHLSVHASGYEWIRKTLARVDSTYNEEYLANFQKHKVKDHRLDDLLAEDWKELIPAIGPRNDFKRIWNNKYGSGDGNESKFRKDGGEYGNNTNANEYYDETTTVTTDNDRGMTDDIDIPLDIQSELLSVLNSDASQDSQESDTESESESEDNDQILTEIEVNKDRYLNVETGDTQARTPTNDTTDFDDEIDSSESKSEEMSDEYYNEDEHTSDEEVVATKGRLTSPTFSEMTQTTVTESVYSPTGDTNPMTFDDLRNKYGMAKQRSKDLKKDKLSVMSGMSSRLSKLSSAMPNNASESADVVSESYYEDSGSSSSDESYLKKIKKPNTHNPIPSPLPEANEETEDLDDDFDDFDIDKPMDFPNKSLVSPGFGAQNQYLSHQSYTKPKPKPNNLSNNSSLSSHSNISLENAQSQYSTASTSLAISDSSTLASPVPAEVNPSELAQPFVDDGFDESEDETIGIPKFEADVDSEGDSQEEEEDDYEEDEEFDDEEEDDEYYEQEYEEYEEEYEDEEEYEED